MNLDYRFLFKRFQVEVSEFNRGAFALQADTAGGLAGFGHFILEKSIDEQLNGVVFAEDVIAIPFAGGIFGAVQLFGNTFDRILVIGGDGHVKFGNRDARTNQIDIPSIAVHQLGFDGVGPHRIRAGCMQQNPAVGGGFDPSPFQMQVIIAVFPLGAEIAVGLAFTMDNAVLDRPDAQRVGRICCPAGEVFA